MNFLAIVGLASLLCNYVNEMGSPYSSYRALPIGKSQFDLLPSPSPFPKLHNNLTNVTKLFSSFVWGSESVEYDENNDSLVMIDRYGFVITAHRNRDHYHDNDHDQTWELDAKQHYVGPGRPLGFHLHKKDSLIICDSLKGLTQLNTTTGVLTILTNAITSPTPATPPLPFNYANDLDISKTGKVYFSSSTEASVELNSQGYFDTMKSYLLSALRGHDGGQLLLFDPTTLETTSIVQNVAYANGVALSEHEDFVLIVESSNARVNTTTGVLTILTNAITSPTPATPPLPFNYANDLDISKTGKVYFSSSTEASVELNSQGYFDTMKSYLLSALRGHDGGQLLLFDPTTLETTSIVQNVAYANGVALSEHEDFVLIVESSNARVLRHWLVGEKAGTTDVFIDNLPAIPDGITRSKFNSNSFWIAFVAPISPLPKLLAKFPKIRTLLSHHILSLYSLVSKSFGGVMRVDSDGKMLQSYFNPLGDIISSTSSCKEGQSPTQLYCGNLLSSGVYLVNLE